MAEKTITEPEPIICRSPNDPWKRVMVLPSRLRVEHPVAVFTLADFVGLGMVGAKPFAQLEGDEKHLKEVNQGGRTIRTASEDK